MGLNFIIDQHKLMLSTIINFLIVVYNFLQIKTTKITKFNSHENVLLYGTLKHVTLFLYIKVTTL